jgi:hypothetical protein
MGLSWQRDGLVSHCRLLMIYHDEHVQHLGEGIWLR